MADYLHRKSTKNVTNGATATGAAGALHTILDTSLLDSQSAFGSCVVKCVLMSSRVFVRFSLYVQPASGDMMLLAPVMNTGPGSTWSSNPEGFINLHKGDKLLAFFEGEPANMEVFSHVSYLYTTND